MPGGGALHPLELCGLLDVFDRRASAHQYGGFLVPFALLAAFLVCVPSLVFNGFDKYAVFGHATFVKSILNIGPGAHTRKAVGRANGNRNRPHW